MANSRGSLWLLSVLLLVSASQWGCDDTTDGDGDIDGDVDGDIDGDGDVDGDGDTDGDGDSDGDSDECPEPDRDGDGHRAVECGGDDCDDDDANCFPGNVEVCDASDHDEDCDPLTFGARDADGDGYPDVACCNEDAGGTRHCGDDCDDAHSVIHPMNTEACDRVDNDCDGEVDEGVLLTFYPDADGDGYGSPIGPTETGCAAPATYVDNDLDCDDGAREVNPAAAERCDGVDNNCDGTTDPGCDCSAGQTRECGEPDGAGGFVDTGECAVGAQRCIDGLWGECVGAVGPRAEVCNDADDDCDGEVDDGVLRTYYRDADFDGFGTADATSRACDRPEGYVELSGDCDDAIPTIRPGSPEVCDGDDNDCDDEVDEAPAASHCSGFYPLARNVNAWACDAGTCEILTCASNRGDCDLDPFNGCEVDTLSSGEHCGGCGGSCGVGGICTSGSCDFITDVVAGYGTTCAVRSGGTLVCWGAGNYGQLADARLPPRSLPVAIPVLADVVGPDVSAHICALNPREMSFPFCWGANAQGQAGIGSIASPVLAPHAVTSNWSIRLAVGANHSCRIELAFNSVYCWGHDEFGQLGRGFHGDPVLDSGTPVVGLELFAATDIAAGDTFTCTVYGLGASAGQVWCWGRNDRGQLGDGTAVQSSSPVRVSGIDDATDVEACDLFGGSACAVRSSGEVWCWGAGDRGQIGDGGTSDRLEPVRVSAPMTFAQVSVGREHACAVSTEGSVYCWGQNEFGQLGNGAVTGDRPTPTEVSPPLAAVTDVACGEQHSCALTTDGSVYCWGRNTEYQLGTAFGDATSPTLVPGI